ncbi:MAG TPA: hypothetical protein VGT41_01995 [Candidatus Babeliales bacterium]|nr:hypothetical protein [Candidatus Babeliales bacterium]
MQTLSKNNNHKKTLYQLLNLYTSDQINAKNFSEEYVNYYDPNAVNFTPDEVQAFSELTNAIHLLAPSQAELERYPDVYISDHRLKEIAFNIKKTLQHYYKEYNIGHQCFFCDKPIMSSHIDPCRMHVKIPIEGTRQCHQYFFCHVKCVEKRVTLKAYFDLPYLGDYHEEGENSEESV